MAEAGALTGGGPLASREVPYAQQLVESSSALQELDEPLSRQRTPDEIKELRQRELKLLRHAAQIDGSQGQVTVAYHGADSGLLAVQP